MTKQEFVDQWTDELSGLLLSSLVLIPEKSAEQFPLARVGRHTLTTLHKVKGILEQMADDKESLDFITDAWIRKQAGVPEAERKAAIMKLRATINPEKAKS